MQTRAPVDADRLAAAARAQAALPDARVSDARRAWAERVPDVWGVTVEGRERTSNAFLHVSGDRVAVPAGLSHAARVLSELDPFDGEPWGGGLVYIVTAAGGTTPGFPDSWHADETPLPDGGMRLTVPMPERWVAYAAAGGVGPAPFTPSGPSAGGGVTAPPEMATATLDIGADYGLQWRYQLADGEIDGPSGAPAGAPPALPDDQLVAALDGARLRARAPRAVPAREPRRWTVIPASSSSTCGRSDPCTSRPTGPARASTGRAPPSALVPLLSAADLLPPGLLPDDLLGTAAVVDGELTASLPAPLVEWAAGDARQLSPRVPGVKPEAEMRRQGRVRAKLGGALDWTLEVADGASWRPAIGGGP